MLTTLVRYVLPAFTRPAENRPAPVPFSPLAPCENLHPLRQ